MKHISLAAATMILSVSLFAQGSMTTPQGGLAKEGTSHAPAFGWYANARYQLFENGHTGKETTITEIAFRLDGRDHTARTAMGRTWASITLDVSETSRYAHVSLTWAQNISKTPTRVFSNRWSWPTVTGSPAVKPAAWGGAGGSLRFPFVRPWRYTGQTAMLMDYVFRGGTMANRLPWVAEADYFLDGQVFRFVASGQLKRLPASSTCSDSKFPVPTVGAEMGAWAFLYGPYTPQVSLRNKMVFQHSSYGTANNAPVVHALGLGGFPTGVDVGARCHRLYVDFSKPLAILYLSTSGTIGSSGQQSWTIPWESALANRHIWAQAAWSDSTTNAFSLTAATRLQLPAAPLMLPPRHNKAVLSPFPDLPVAYRPFTVAEFAIPCTRYKTQ